VIISETVASLVLITAVAWTVTDSTTLRTFLAHCGHAALARRAPASNRSHASAESRCLRTGLFLSALCRRCIRPWLHAPCAPILVRLSVTRFPTLRTLGKGSIPLSCHIMRHRAKMRRPATATPTHA
jgi:hypothetical protein